MIDSFERSAIRALQPSRTIKSPRGRALPVRRETRYQTASLGGQPAAQTLARISRYSDANVAVLTKTLQLADRRHPEADRKQQPQKCGSRATGYLLRNPLFTSKRRWDSLSGNRGWVVSVGSRTNGKLNAIPEHCRPSQRPCIPVPSVQTAEPDPYWQAAAARGGRQRFGYIAAGRRWDRFPARSFRANRKLSVSSRHERRRRFQLQIEAQQAFLKTLIPIVSMSDGMELFAEQNGRERRRRPAQAVAARTQVRAAIPGSGGVLRGLEIPAPTG